MECALRSHDVERAANNRAVGAQPAPLVERFLTSLCGEWWSEPSRPQSLCALADECRAPRNAGATATGEGACFGWSCPRATRARSRQYVLRPPCLCHLLQPQTEVRIARSGCRRRGACHMPLPGGGTTRIKRCQSIWSNHTPRSMSIRWAMVHFGGMGSPNIYFQECTCYSPWPWWRSGAVAECSAVRKRRGTPRQHVGQNAHDHRLFCCVLHRCKSHRCTHFGSVAKFDFGAKSKNRASEIQRLTDSQTLEKATLRQNPGRYSPGPNIGLPSWLKGSDPNFTITVFWGQPGARATVSIKIRIRING